MSAPLLLLALVLAEPPPASDEITVTGLREAEIRRQASELVRTALPPVPQGGQYARWNVPVCPKVQGLPDPRVAERVLTRFRAIAAEVGAPVGRANCRPNILIRFTTDAAAVADRIFAKNADAALKIESLDREALRRRPFPVRWWFGWRVEDGSGSSAGDAGGLSVAMAGGDGGGGGAGAAPTEIPGGGYSVGGNSAASLITAKSRVSLTGATVLVDVDLAAGYPLDAVTAQLAMAVLGQAAVRNEVPASLSVLGLFRGPAAEAPRELTAWDKALLKALYSIPPNREQSRQRNMLVAAIAKDRLNGPE